MLNKSTFFICTLNVLEYLTSWCCNVLKKHPDFVPHVTWGSLVDGHTKNQWDKKNCNDRVGHTTKSLCLGKIRA